MRAWGRKKQAVKCRVFGKIFIVVVRVETNQNESIDYEKTKRL
jgi:hypothetical protein